MNIAKEESISLVRNYKDSVFRMVFNDKQNLIDLYNAIFDTDYTIETPLEFKTIEEVLFKTVKNDIAFTIADTFIVLMEHQSTINENMAIRDLIYFAATIQKMFSNTDFYRKKALRLPNPTFVVLYNGTEEMSDYDTINLSDHYIMEEANPALQLTVKVYNVNEGKQTELLKRCRILWEYSRFVTIVRENKEERPMSTEVIRQILKQCQEEGILTDFLKEHGSEAVNMLFLEMTEEEARELSKQDGFEEGYEEGVEKGIKEGVKKGIQEGIQRGIQEGIQEGILEGMRIAAKKMKEKNAAIPMIAECTGLSEEEVENL